MIDECTDSEGMTPTCICGLLFLLLLLLFVECSVIIYLIISVWSPLHDGLSQFLLVVYAQGSARKPGQFGPSNLRDIVALRDWVVDHHG